MKNTGMGGLRAHGRLSILLLLVLACAETDEAPPASDDHVNALVLPGLDGIPLATLDTLYVTNTESAPSPMHMVSGAALLPDGGVVVASRGTAELQFYDGTGAFAGSAGRSGDGPGEFRALVGVWNLPEGGLLTWDPVLRRASYWTTDGELLSEELYEAEYLNPPRVVGLARGGFVLIHERFEAPGTPGEFVDMPADYVWVPYDGSRPDTLGRFPWRRLARGEGQVRGVLWSLFDGIGHGAATGDDFWFGDGRVPSLTRFGLDGEPNLTVAWETPDRSTTAADVEAWKQRAESNASGSPQSNRRWAEAVVEQFGVADSFPAFDRLFADSDGRVWSRYSPPPNRPGDAEWLVLDGEGTPQWRFATAKSVHILDARADLVVVLLTNDLGLESVAVGQLRL